MTERAPKTPIDEALQRRISDALSDEDGLAGNPELSALLSSNKGAGSYAKDLARINKWLMSWPVPAPSDEAFEALATRIEQRLGETLPGAASTFFGPPDFDDDDATRDATAGLLGPAPRAVLPAASLGTKKGTLVGMPPAAKAAIAPPRSPLAPLKPLGGSKPLGASKPLVAKPLGAKVGDGALKPLSPLAKKIAEAKGATTEAEAQADHQAEAETKAEAAPTEPTAIEPAPEAKPAAPPKVAAPAADARTTDDLPVITSGELELVASPSIPPEPISIPPEAISIPPSAAVPADTAAPPPPPSAKKKKRKSKAPPPMAAGDAIEDRISIPMPAPIAPLPVTDLSAARVAKDKDERKGGGWWPVLAAAAVIAIVVGGGMTLFGGGRMADEPMAATATLAPAEDAADDELGGLPSVTASAPAAPPAAATPMPTEPMPSDPSAEPAVTAALEVAEAESSGGLDDSAWREEALARDDYAPTRRARASAPRSAAGSGGGGGGLASATTGAPIGGTSSLESPRGGGARAGGSTAGSSGSTASAGSTEGGGGSGRGTASGDSTRTAPPPPVTRTPSGPVPESPSRDDVRDALEGVRPQVQACFGEEHGLAEVVVIAASSGRVTTATVSGRFAGTPVGSCIARAVRAARMPPFSNPRFEVHYQYRY